MTSQNSRPDPEELLADARGGHGESLGLLLELYRNYLALLARTQIDSGLVRRVSASDLVQETFLEAHRDFGQFRGNSQRELVAWLRRILLRNLATAVEKHLMTRKRNARRDRSLVERVNDLERSSVQFERALVGTVSTPSQQALRHELLTILADQLAELPADYREVLVLRNLEGLAFEEVGRRMGRSPGAVRMLWLRALDEMRHLFRRENLI